MDEIIQDARNKGLISFQKEDFIVEALKNPVNHGRISLALATTKLDRYDKLDIVLVAYQKLN